MNLKRLAQPLGGAALMAVFIGALVLKFLLFDLIWAFDTTFSGFQFPIGYLMKLCLATLLALPLLAIRRKAYVYVVCVLVDIWLVANLMYFRTYYTVIPFSSYGLAGNLADFQESVWESLRLPDLVFPATTIALAALLWHTSAKKALASVSRKMRLTLLGCVLVPLAVVTFHSLCKGGFKASYEDLMYDYSTCGAAYYTIPGTWLYSYVAEESELTPEVRERIEAWLDAREGATDSIPALPCEPPTDCIVILCESLESWVIGTEVDGVELTPNINRYMRADSGVFYAPRMLSQVRGARSIDAQLILHTGLLPVAYGAYSTRFPHNTYPSLDKAFKSCYPDGQTMSFTVDKKIVWNAVIAAQDFGYDHLLDKPYFELDVATGPRGRLGDHSFLRQSAEKLEGEELFKSGGHSLVQLVTYSGHTPFVIPDSLKTVTFDEAYPERLRNYMTVANYTDRAIGAFLDRISANPKFARTMVVITGDHEGLGIDRDKMVADPRVAAFVSAEQFVPFLVLNSPVTGRYDGVVGQVDFYPTMLHLLGLRDYPWRGLGRDILDPGRRPFAVMPSGRAVGMPADSIPEAALRHARDAFSIADIIISTDYFKHSSADERQ